MKSISRSIIALVFLTCFSSSYIYSQQKEKPRNKFEYEKSFDGSKKLSARIFVKTKLGLTGVSGINISFTASNDSIKNDLGAATTDEDGWGYLVIDKSVTLPQTEGKTTFGLIFKGNDSLRRLTDDLDIIDVKLALKTEEDGEVKKVTAFVTDFQDQPVDRTKVKLYVKRLYSLLPIGEDRTDSLGKVGFEVPGDIPGDFEGNITLVGSIERDRKYGNVEIREAINWGIPNTYTVSEEVKNLWTLSAPLWMEIAVFTVFAVVAVFFFYALYQVFMIPRNH